MRILIIEDEYSLADMLRDCLEKEKYVVDISLNGEDGFYRAETEIYDLIILDILIPKLNGFEVLKRIRKKNHELSVLILTAKAELDDKLNGFELGADDYMTKPFEMKELLARVRVLLKRKSGFEEKKISYCDLILNPDQLKLCSTMSNKEILLGNKEYLLMEYLMLNANCILSKEQISNKIWGYENNVEYNNAEVYVSFLRKKLLFLESRAKINTVRGIGYSLGESRGVV